MTAIGIDTHKATLAACAVDELGRPVGEATFAISMAPRSPAKLRLKPGSTGTTARPGQCAPDSSGDDTILRGGYADRSHWSTFGTQRSWNRPWPRT